MLYLLESADCPAIDELSTKVKSPVTCVIPRLAVRKLLVDVANELNESAEDFIGYAAEDLKINPQKFQTQDAGHREGLLELFKCALKQCLITDDNLLNLKEWLHKVDAEAILIDIIKGFDPNIPLCLPQQSPTGNSINTGHYSIHENSCSHVLEIVQLWSWVCTLHGSSTVVSWKNAHHGQSTLQTCQRGGWALFRVFPHLTMKEQPCMLTLTVLEFMTYRTNIQQRCQLWKLKF